MRAVVPWLLFACACGGGSGGPDGVPAPDAGDDRPRLDRVGLVNLIEGSAFNAVYASIQDGPELPTMREDSHHGECTIYVRPDPALCEPPCGDGVCTAPGTCTPYPTPVSAGDITVTGLHDPLVFRPGQFGYAPDPAPSGDLFDAGAAIHLAAPGAAVPGFAADLTGVAELVAPFQNLTLVDGQDQDVTWTAGDGRIQLQLVVGWHGAPPEAMMICETADDGVLTIPGDAIAALPRASSGLEQHGSFLGRFDRAIVAAPAGPIEIVVASQISVPFTHL